MAHPTFANTTVVGREVWPAPEQVPGGCAPEGFGGLRIAGCWVDEALMLEGDSGLGLDSGTQI